ncbi:MAG: exodeoxyribonuclease VII small subunit [Candidatus Bipolaricaulota bacterium]
MTEQERTSGTPNVSYTEAVERLDAILERIEGGEADIDELSGLVEEAAQLLELCREKIAHAEMQVKSVTQRLEAEQTEPSEQEAEPPAEKEDEVPF